MGRSKETAGKKDKENKKAKKRKEKDEKREERKLNNNKGKGLETMMAWVDENGNLIDAPPDPTKKVEINVEDIQINIAQQHKELQETTRKGVITYINDQKGYGFINDLKTQERVLVLLSQYTEMIRQNDKVTFEARRSPRGLTAENVKKVGNK